MGETKRDMRSFDKNFARYRDTGITRPHVTKDGEEIDLHRFDADCIDCGAPYSVWISWGSHETTKAWSSARCVSCIAARRSI